MNKTTVGVLIGIVLALCSIGLYFILGGPDQSNPTTAKEVIEKLNLKDPSAEEAQSFTACDILTPEKAAEIIGGKVKMSPGQDKEGTADASTLDAEITLCSLIADDATQTDSLKLSSITLLAQVPKTKVGVANNILAMDNPQGNTVPIEGAGDRAYYSTLAKQAYILKGRNLYVLWYYPGSEKASTFDNTSKAARELSYK